MPVRAVLFDLDGTLIDSHDDIFAAFSAAAQELRFQVPGEDALRGLVGLPLAVMFRGVYGEDLAPEQVASLTDAYRRHYNARPAERTRIFPGVPETLRALAPRAIGVATTKRTWQAQRVMQALGLDAHVAVVQGTDDFPAKPAPDVLQHALARLGQRPEDAAYVGDGPWDMQAARSAGMLAIGVDHAGDRAPDLLDAGANRVLRGMHELAPWIERLS